MNLIITLEELSRTAEYLRKKFEVKDLGKNKFYLRLELEHNAHGILIHQSAYTEIVLKHFNMDKAHHSSTQMVVWSLEP